jgi:L-ascorbate metabolism protein UlaG (beta-lactamase superfamily)
LLQIPRPASAIRHGSRIYYNILIDPWFVGGQSDVAKWFSQQWHAIESAVKSVAEVDELARQVEILAGGLRAGDKSRKYGSLGRNGTVGRANVVEAVEEETLIDVVAISHEFTDHCHKDTLLEVSRDVPVLATEVCLPTSFTYQQDL